jgi:hypothetical protein
MPRPRNFLEALAGALPGAGEAFGNALLMKQKRDDLMAEREEDVAHRNALFEFPKQQHADRLRQDEVDRANKMLGLDAGPVQYNLKEATPPSTFEGAAVRHFASGGTADDPFYQNLVTAERTFNPAGSQSNAKLPIDIGGMFATEANKLLADWSQQRALTERAPSVQVTDPISGDIKAVRPAFTTPRPDIANMWWARYAPMAGTAGLNADSIRQNLALMYPELAADRRPGSDREPVDPFSVGGNMLLQGFGNAARSTAAVTRQAAPTSPPPNDGSLTDEEYRQFVAMWNRGEIR